MPKCALTKVVLALEVKNTILPHIVAAATVLFSNGKTLKNSYRFHISFSPNENLNSFLNRMGKLFKGGKYSWEERI